MSAPWTPSGEDRHPATSRSGNTSARRTYHPQVDENPSSGVPDQLRSALEPLADLSRRMADLVRSATASGLARSPASDLLIRSAEQLSAVPRLWAGPLRHMVEEQRRMAELMAAWAQQHRELAEQLAQSAEQLRRLSEDAAALIEPMLTYAERVSEVTDSWIDLLRPGTRRDRRSARLSSSRRSTSPLTRSRYRSAGTSGSAWVTEQIRNRPAGRTDSRPSP
jgi:uncharacterized membrane-anchored protein YhcB (DUF1043 family)